MRRTVMMMSFLFDYSTDESIIIVSNSCENWKKIVMTHKIVKLNFFKIVNIKSYQFYMQQIVLSSVNN